MPVFDLAGVVFACSRHFKVTVTIKQALRGVLGTVTLVRISTQAVPRHLILDCWAFELSVNR